MSTLDGLSMPSICLGTSPLGGMPDIYGYDVDEAQAVATIRHALDCGLTFIDTSNEYGDGESERRIGSVLRELGASGQRVLIASKADPARAQRILDGDRVRERQIGRVRERSIERESRRTCDAEAIHQRTRLLLIEQSAAAVTGRARARHHRPWRAPT